MNQKCFSLTTPCQCDDGFGLNVAGDCKDIDECATDSESCSNNSTCINTEGSYQCFRNTTEETTLPITSTMETTTSSPATTTTLTTGLVTTTVPTSTALTTESITTPKSLGNWVFVMSTDYGVKSPMLLNGFGEYKAGIFHES